MGVHTVRMPDNLDEYLNRLISKGYATSYANALNLVVLERMMKDDKGKNLTPFHYTLKDNRTKDKVVLSEIETNNVVIIDDVEIVEPERDPIEIPVESPVTIENNLQEMRKMKKPIYPGSMEEYKHDSKRNMFEPPED